MTESKQFLPMIMAVLPINHNITASMYGLGKKQVMSITRKNPISKKNAHDKAKLRLINLSFNCSWKEDANEKYGHFSHPIYYLTCFDSSYISIKQGDVQPYKINTFWKQLKFFLVQLLIDISLTYLLHNKYQWLSQPKML